MSDDRRAYRTELDPNDIQRETFRQHAGACRWVWNQALAVSNRYYDETGKRPKSYQLNLLLTQWKKSQRVRGNCWLDDVSVSALQEMFCHLDDAFQHFFDICKKRKAGDPATLQAIEDAKPRKDGKPYGFPRFKSKHGWTPSFTLRGTIRVHERAIQLPKIGVVRLKERGYLPTDANIKSATISKRTVNGGRWFVAVLVEEDTNNDAGTNGKVIGIDCGLTAWVTTSDRREWPRPDKLKYLQTKLRRLQRKAQRKEDHRKAEGRKRKSKRWRKTQKRITRVHRRIANCRENHLHELTTALTGKNAPPEERPQAIVIEDLQVKNMIQNKHLARTISDAAWGELRRQLEYKTEQLGIELIAVNPAYTSQTCSQCGHVDADSRSDKRFCCTACGYEADADYNAARNIRKRGMKHLTGKAPAVQTDVEECCS